jgi:hypothetical protein
LESCVVLATDLLFVAVVNKPLLAIVTMELDYVVVFVVVVVAAVDVTDVDKYYYYY